MVSSKIKLYIHAVQATHFLRWEIPYFKKYFEMVERPQQDAVLFAFGADALATGANLPARIRAVLLLPGFGYHPYHDLIQRYEMQCIVDKHYDIVFANPGPIAEAFKNHPKLRICPLSIDTDNITMYRFRKSINSLIHISADSPQKDWKRSRDTMKLTGLKYEVFPPRNNNLVYHATRWIRGKLSERNLIHVSPLFQAGYVEHNKVIKKYLQYDGFVHIAGETPPVADGKYTATLLEAGLTGSILFWHDTLGLGNDFETIFSLPKDPRTAANEILNIRKSIDVEAHSRRTVEEIREKASPDKSVRLRFELISEMIE